MSYELIFKDWRDAADFGRLNELLFPIMEEIIAAASDTHGERMVVTSVFRKTSPIHRAYRAVDMVPASRGTAVMEWLRDQVNAAWDYGHDDYQVIPDINHGTAPHLHVQVHPGTRRKLGEGEGKE